VAKEALDLAFSEHSQVPQSAASPRQNAAHALWPFPCLHRYNVPNACRGWEHKTLTPRLGMLSFQHGKLLAKRQVSQEEVAARAGSAEQLGDGIVIQRRFSETIFCV